MPTLSPNQLEDLAYVLLGAAHVDEHFHDKERDSLVEKLSEEFDLRPIPRALWEALSTFKWEEFDLAERCRSLQSLDSKERRQVLRLVAELTLADGVIDLRENSFLLKVADTLGATRDELTELVDEYVATFRRS